jgi:hypothetical protein
MGIWLFGGGSTVEHGAKRIPDVSIVAFHYYEERD